VERLSKADRACAVAAAAGHDLNDELTIILNCSGRILETLEPGHPARPLIVDLQQAAQRCVGKASGLLNFSSRRGIAGTSVPMERLVLESEEPAFR
jgi:hypothetical protein